LRSKGCEEDGQGREYDAREHRAVIEHDRQIHHHEEQVDPAGERLARQEGARIVQFAHPRDGVTRPAALEIAHGQTHQVPEQLRSQLHVQPAGGVGEQVVPHAAEHHFEHRQRGQCQGQHIQRREAAMCEHLVDHHLEDQWRHQRKHLHEQRSQQHLAEQAAVLFHGLQEPAHAKLRLHTLRGRVAGQAAARVEPFAAPDRLQLLAAYTLRLRLALALQNETLVGCGPHNGQFPVFERHHHGLVLLAQAGG
jgi:hypothetical protein